jgi:dolichol-phosphate mannosyltransferase
MRTNSLSVFFPTYNERQNIEKTLDQAELFIPALGIENYEIFVIDDGSQDGCNQLVEDRAAQNEHIHLVRHSQRRGYGATIRTGFAHTTREAIFYTDCDLTVDLRELGRALPLLEHADLVVGYRKKRHETFPWVVYSRIYSLLLWALYGVRVRDAGFSFILVNRRVLQGVHLTAETAFINGQLLAEAQRLKFRIVEIPVEYIPHQPGHSNSASLQAYKETLAELFTYWNHHIRTKEKESVVTVP